MADVLLSNCYYVLDARVIGFTGRRAIGPAGRPGRGTEPPSKVRSAPPRRRDRAQWAFSSPPPCARPRGLVSAQQRSEINERASAAFVHNTEGVRSSPRPRPSKRTSTDLICTQWRAGRLMTFGRLVDLPAGRRGRRPFSNEPLFASNGEVLGRWWTSKREGACWCSETGKFFAIIREIFTNCRSKSTLPGFALCVVSQLRAPSVVTARRAPARPGPDGASRDSARLRSSLAARLGSRAPRPRDAPRTVPAPGRSRSPAFGIAPRPARVVGAARSR